MAESACSFHTATFMPSHHRCARVAKEMRYHTGSIWRGGARASLRMKAQDALASSFIASQEMGSVGGLLICPQLRLQIPPQGPPVCMDIPLKRPKQPTSLIITGTEQGCSMAL